MEFSEADFTTPNALDTAILQFTALVLTQPLQEATGEAFDDLDDDDELLKLVVPPPLSPCKPKPKTGPKRQATADLARKFPLRLHIPLARNKHLRRNLNMEFCHIRYMVG